MPLAEQDRSRWDATLIAEGVEILQAALARDQLGEYQAQAAIAALHCDARSVAETDWVQIVEWYDELIALTGSPVHRLNRAVAVGEADGAPAGLAALEPLDPTLPRYEAVAAHLYEMAGERRSVRRSRPSGDLGARTRPPHPSVGAAAGHHVSVGTADHHVAREEVVGWDAHALTTPGRTRSPGPPGRTGSCGRCEQPSPAPPPATAPR